MRILNVSTTKGIRQGSIDSGILRCKAMLMSAQIAYKNTEKINREKDNSELIKIKKVIDKSIQDGDFYTYIDGRISDTNEMLLKSLGYEIELIQLINEYSTRISWDKKEENLC